MREIAVLVSKHNPGVVSMAKNLEEVTGKVSVYYLEELFPNEFAFRLERRFFNNSSVSLARRKLTELVKDYNNRIILGGWSPIHEKIVNLIYLSGAIPSVMWCSTLGQMEMTCKMGDYKALLSLLSLNSEKKIRYILLNERLYEEMGFIKNAIFFPHTLNLNKFNAYFKPRPEFSSGVFNIDLFVALRSGKNILAQISSVKLSKHSDNINLHINFKHPYIKRIVEFWNVNIKEHGWLKWEEYLALISNMHLSLQVTHTESFNYAVAERMAMGVPSLVSYNIYNVCKDDFLKKYLCVDAVDSPSIIRNKLDYLLDNTSLLMELRERVHERINVLMKRKNLKAQSLLEQLFYEKP